MDEPEKDTDKLPVPSYGLLVINHAYNEGKITFREWLELSRQWALKQIEENHKTEGKRRSKKLGGGQTPPLNGRIC
jgi:hypothetical protein